MAKFWREELFKYITGIVTNKGQKMMAVNGVVDQIHLLVSIAPSCNMSDLVRDIKANSSKWVNVKRFVAGGFLVAKWIWYIFRGNMEFGCHREIHLESGKSSSKKKRLKQNMMAYLMTIKSNSKRSIFSTPLW